MRVFVDLPDCAIRVDEIVAYKLVRNGLCNGRPSDLTTHVFVRSSMYPYTFEGDHMRTIARSLMVTPFEEARP